MLRLDTEVGPLTPCVPFATPFVPFVTAFVPFCTLAVGRAGDRELVRGGVLGPDGLGLSTLPGIRV